VPRDLQVCIEELCVSRESWVTLPCNHGLCWPCFERLIASEVPYIL
jgi:hypothetical protein